MSKRNAVASPAMSEYPKRMRQSTLTFGKSEVSDSVRRQDGGKFIWHESRGLLRMQTKDWLSKETSEDASEEFQKLKVAAFDLDHTLIKTKTAGKFPRYPTDYQFLNRKVLPKLRELSEEGCLLAVFSNQASVGTGRNDASFIKSRVEAIVEDISLPIAVFIATNKDNYRKPCIGMWLTFLDLIGGREKVDFQGSFFAGDAAGRNGDFANSDLKFSINVEVKFWTPENIFEDKIYDPKELSLDGFDPRELVTLNEYVMEDPLNKPSKTDHLKRIVSSPQMCDALIEGWCSDEANAKPKQQCLVMTVGPPASGKTTFSKRFFEEEGYIWINLDTMGTTAKCVKATRAGLETGRSVVVDNTSANKAARARYVQLAKAHDKSMPVYCLKMETSKELALHLNVVRELHTSGTVRRIPQVAFNSYFKRAVEPSAEEGYALIASVKFVPYFTSEREKYGFTRLS